MVRNIVIPSDSTYLQLKCYGFGRCVERIDMKLPPCSLSALPSQFGDELA